MNIINGVIYGLVGSTIGGLLPSISKKIIIYKRSKQNIISDENIVYSNFLKVILLSINCLTWFLAGLYLENMFFALLISTQITFGLLIAIIDIKIRIIPNELVLIMFVVGIIFQTINYGMQGIVGSIVCMIFIVVVFTAVAGFMGFGKVGAGDIKLAGAIGFSLGYPLLMTAMITMAIVLLTYIVVGLALKKIKLTTMLPLAPFLTIGYIFSLLTLIIGKNLY